MKKFILLPVLLMGNINAATINWTLQLTNPQYEVTNITLPKKSYKPFLPKTSWRCTFDKTIKNADRETKSINCNYSIKSSGQFTTYVSCSKKIPYGESKIDLVDDKKKLSWSVLVFCHYQN